MRRGFSFLEILIAVAILAVVGIAVVSAIGSSAREVRTTSEYSLSMFLSQKIVEDLIQSSHENPHYAESLADINNLRMPVAGAPHPYFSALEDTKTPYGLLQPGQDVGVEPLSPEVFRLYRQFNLTLGSAALNLPPVGTTNPVVHDVKMLFDWPGLKNTARDYEFPVQLSTPQVSLKHTPYVAQDLPGLDNAIRDLVYPGATAPLPTVVGGGNLQAVRDVGAVVAIVKFTEDEVAKVDAAMGAVTVQLFPVPPTSPEEEGTLRLKLAGLVERRAALRWFALLYMETPAGAQMTAFKKSDLGNQPYSRSALTGGIGEACELLGYVQEDIQIALHHYGTARNKLGVPSSRMYRRMALERKILELLKLRAMLDQSNDLTLLRQWQDYLIQLHTGRTRAFADFVTRERDKTPNLAALQASNQKIADRCNEARQANDNLDDLSRRVSQEMRR